jgi:RNA polymerase sigma factor for flagellar operon FliA
MKTLAVQELAVAHLDLVRAVARRVQRAVGGWPDFDDLCAAGTVGLVQAAGRYRPSAGVAFATFAYYRIQGSMYDALRDLGQLRRGGEEDEVARLPVVAPSPDEELERARAAATLRRAIAALPAAKRALLERHYYRGDTLQDAGRHLGFSKSWASRLHAQALAELRGALSPDLALAPGG